MDQFEDEESFNDMDSLVLRKDGHWLNKIKGEIPVCAQVTKDLNTYEYCIVFGSEKKKGNVFKALNEVNFANFKDGPIYTLYAVGGFLVLRGIVNLIDPSRNLKKSFFTDFDPTGQYLCNQHCANKKAKVYLETLKTKTTKSLKLTETQIDSIKSRIKGMENDVFGGEEEKRKWTTELEKARGQKGHIT